MGIIQPQFALFYGRFAMQKMKLFDIFKCGLHVLNLFIYSAFNSNTKFAAEKDAQQPK